MMQQHPFPSSLLPILGGQKKKPSKARVKGIESSLFSIGSEVLLLLSELPYFLLSVSRESGSSEAHVRSKNHKGEEICS